MINFINQYFHMCNFNSCVVLALYVDNMNDGNADI